MALSRTRALMPLVAALAVSAVGCAKAKSALEAAAGAAPLSDDEVTQIKTAVQWNDNDPLYKNMAVEGGFKLTDTFQGDLDQSISIPLPGVSIPDAGKDAAGNEKSMLLVKQIPVVIDSKTTYQRLQIISIARFDSTSSSLDVDGDTVNQNMDPDQIVSQANKNEAGSYLIITAKGNTGFTFLTGTVTLHRNPAAATDDNVKGAWVFTTSSPFVTETGGQGKYFLSMLQGSKGQVIAFKGDIASAGPGTGSGGGAGGTPASTSTDVSYAGILDQFQGAMDAKVSQLNQWLPNAQSQADSAFTQLDSKVTTSVNGWKIVPKSLVFTQPPLPPAAPTPPPAPSQTNPKPTPQPPNAPPPTTTDPSLIRVDPTTPPQYNVDLGCKGYSNDGKTALDIIRDGGYFSDYTGHPGWRGIGDVRYAFDLADVIFAQPAGADPSRNLNGTQLGYCLITTTDATLNDAKTNNDDTTPYTNEATSSEMFQMVQVPATAKSIVIRAAFFSTEFPKFVGSQYNDSFFIKFDESPNMIASGNLNDLAGMTSDPSSPYAKDQTNIQNCKGYTYAAKKGQTCGDWAWVADMPIPSGVTGETANGELWDIADATNTPHDGDVMGCLVGNGATSTTAPNKQCWHGYVPPRTFCTDLDTNDIGQQRTLRFNVTNVGDTFFPSALAVDSVEFSTNACAGTKTNDPPSRASML